MYRAERARAPQSGSGYSRGRSSPGNLRTAHVRFPARHFPRPYRGAPPLQDPQHPKGRAKQADMYAKLSPFSFHIFKYFLVYHKSRTFDTVYGKINKKITRRLSEKPTGNEFKLNRTSQRAARALRQARCSEASEPDPCGRRACATYMQRKGAWCTTFRFPAFCPRRTA